MMATEIPKTVRIHLFKDRQNYASDVFVSVNGVHFQIQRGVDVDVPAYVAEVLENSLREDENAAQRMEQAEQVYLEKSRAMK